MFQYLAWVKKESPTQWNGNKLLSDTQIGSVKAALFNKTTEVHESIQRYDKNGNIIFTHLYADFDGPSASVDTLAYVEMIEREFNVTPDIYFSGRKGYHVIINYKVYHAYPHLIAKEFAILFTKQAPTLDLQVYASRHMLRSEGSFHLKSGLYKVRITKDIVGAEAIKTIASKFRITESLPHESHLLNLFIPTIVAKVDIEKQSSDEKYRSIISSNNGEISPCIQSILNRPAVPGQNNNIITLMARNLNSIGMEMNEAIEHVLSHEHWTGFNREVRATFQSIWKRPSKFGCHKESVLRDHCDPFCHFNTNELAV